MYVVGFALDLDGSSKLAVHDHDLAIFLENRDGYSGYRPIEEITEERHAARDPDRTGCAAARAVIEQRVQQYATSQAGALQRWHDVQNLDQAFIAV